MVARFQKGVARRFQPKSVLVELPFEYVNEAGQRVTGFMDLVLETEAGWIWVDPKSFPGSKKEWEAKALSYPGQLKCYREAFVKSGHHCLGVWVHFAVGGGLLEVSEGVVTQKKQPLNRI